MSQIMKDRSASVFATNRLEALTDGVFAIAMTLLVLEISIPEIVNPSQAEIPKRLLELWPKFFSYVLSFIVLGFLWYLHHFTFRYIKRSDYALVWLNILFLMFIGLIPFLTSIIGSYGIGHIPLVLYSINGLLAVITRLLIWIYATGKHRLVDSDISPRLVKWDTINQVIVCAIFILAIGISFINFIAAFSILVIFVLFHLIVVNRLLKRFA